jgi:hypothetical protein
VKRTYTNTKAGLLPDCSVPSLFIPCTIAAVKPFVYGE